MNVSEINDGQRRWTIDLNLVGQHQFRISRRTSRRREDGHHPDVPAAAFCADEMPVLRHVNKDYIVPEFQLLERLHRLMVTADAEAMRGERRLAGGASVGNGLCRLATRHLETISSGLNMNRPSAAP